MGYMSIDDYLRQVTSQYQSSPKFMAWMKHHIDTLDGTKEILKNFNFYYDIDEAIGTQLDALGETVGRNRQLDFQPLNGYNPIMTDEVYRLVIKAKIAMNMWDGLLDGIYDIWDNIFEDISLEIKDNQDMTIDAYVVGFVNQIRQYLVQEGMIVPRPEGVKINYYTKSYIKDDLYVGMTVCEGVRQTIDMKYTPEPSKFDTNVGIVVSNVIKSTINMKSFKRIINIKEGNYLSTLDRKIIKF
ncbi:DUF2612 domain-containing protein [Clostridium butyricum]|uniref:DUF2612 domain-containing protein n=1 Tax=Clostridium butyricum TaxID=1492 RepID=UPI000903C4C8|nr:DUF2612 domain-containing protein [Clostridium butyricum]APF21690.1 hypothetical protein NPD4_3577 [Clostridium butyricum]